MGNKYPYDEFCTVILTAAPVADNNAPTLDEIDGGEDITCFLAKDGLNPGGTTNKVDGGGLCNRLDSQTIGTVGYDMTLKGFRYTTDGDGDVLWDLVDWGENRSLIIRRGIQYGTAWAAGQKVEVYTGQTGEPVMQGSATNTNQMFEVGFAVDSADIKATVVAS